MNAVLTELLAAAWRGIMRRWGCSVALVLVPFVIALLILLASFAQD